MQRSTGPLPRTLLALFGLLALVASAAVPPAIAQESIVPVKNPPVETRQFGDLAEGPYNRLVIQNVNVLPGHGGPSVGTYDILIEGNVISQMRRFDPYTPESEWEHLEGDRVIDGRGKWVMPGLINLHLHLREEPLPLDYVYFLQLATGVTTVGPASDRGLDEARTDAYRSARNEMLAPRMYPLWSWGQGISGFSRADLEDPEKAPEIAEAMVAAGYMERLEADCVRFECAYSVFVYYSSVDTVQVSAPL